MHRRNERGVPAYFAGDSEGIITGLASLRLGPVVGPLRGRCASPGNCRAAQLLSVLHLPQLFTSARTPAGDVLHHAAGMELIDLLVRPDMTLRYFRLFRTLMRTGRLRSGSDPLTLEGCWIRRGRLSSMEISRLELRV